MRILILDTETTGLDPKSDHCIELGLVTYETSCASVLSAYSTIIASVDKNPIEHTNRIPSALLEHGEEVEAAWDIADAWASECKYIVAHNCDFDKGFVPSTDYEALQDTPWLDSMLIEWPRASKPMQSLINTCLDHGVGVTDPHRALSDCLMLARLFSRCADEGHDIDTMIERANAPRVLVQALIEYKDNHLAKEVGFKYHSETKSWRSKMFVRDLEKLKFNYRRIAE